MPLWKYIIYKMWFTGLHQLRDFLLLGKITFSGQRRGAEKTHRITHSLHCSRVRTGRASLIALTIGNPQPLIPVLPLMVIIPTKMLWWLLASGFWLWCMPEHSWSLSQMAVLLSLGRETSLPMATICLLIREIGSLFSNRSFFSWEIWNVLPWIGTEDSTVRHRTTSVVCGLRKAQVYWPWCQSPVLLNYVLIKVWFQGPSFHPPATNPHYSFKVPSNH